MAYVSQERKRKIAPLVKKICAKYGISGSLSVRNHTSLVLTIKAGRIDFIGNSNRVCGSSHYQVSQGFKPNTRGYSDVNPYWFQDHYDGEARACLTELFAALKSDGWYDRSDAQTDYFDTAYYVDINIGKWNQPYTLVRPAVKKPLKREIRPSQKIRVILQNDFTIYTTVGKYTEVLGKPIHCEAVKYALDSLRADEIGIVTSYKNLDVQVNLCEK